MQCPYFKKVNFHRIQQRQQIEDQIQKNIQISKIRFPFQKQFQLFEDSIPEEGCTNNVKIQNYNRVSRYDSSHSQEIEQQQDKIITIKMPKILEIKQFNIEQKQPHKGTINHFHKNIQSFTFKTNKIEAELSQIQEEYSEIDKTQMKHKSAQVFSTHRNMFLQNCFYSVVYLPKSNQYCFCQLDQKILKIVAAADQQNFKTENNVRIRQRISWENKNLNGRIKYFIDLKKFKVSIHRIKQNVLEICVVCRNKNEQFTIQFCNQNERCTFQCVYVSIFEEINQNQEENKNNNKPFVSNSALLPKKQNQSQQSELSFSESYQNSMDSLMFSVERMSFDKAKLFLNTFDIILFKGKNIMSKMQRFFTNSDFDHVALVMKTVGSSLLLLEATGNVGVAIYSFSSIYVALKSKLYQRVAIRKFGEKKQGNFVEKTKKLFAMQQFVKQVNGKKYKFDPMYLISSNIKKKKQNGESNYEQQTYFCSQLVAQALQRCGILKKSKPSYKFLPKHFGNFQNLNSELNDGYHYSDTIILQK